MLVTLALLVLHFLTLFGSVPAMFKEWRSRDDDHHCQNFRAAANGGVTNGGLSCVWPPFLEISRNRPLSPFFCSFHPFPRVLRAPGKSRKRRNKAFFCRCPQICLNPRLLNPRLRHSKIRLMSYPVRPPCALSLLLAESLSCNHMRSNTTSLT